MVGMDLQTRSSNEPDGCKAQIQSHALRLGECREGHIPRCRQDTFGFTALQD